MASLQFFEVVKNHRCTWGRGKGNETGPNWQFFEKLVSKNPTEILELGGRPFDHLHTWISCVSVTNLFVCQCDGLLKGFSGAVPNPLLLVALARLQQHLLPALALAGLAKQHCSLERRSYKI